MIDYAAARLNMVEGQLRTNKVTDAAVLDAFLAVPRERFVQLSLRGIAYVDDDIPLGGGRTLIEPMVLARLLQLASIGPADNVLEIGCATGYATALLARMAATVTALESNSPMATRARALLKELDCTGANVVEGKLTDGWRASAPYDVIVLNGAVGAIPPAVADQLAEGGRLVGVVLAETGPAAGAGMGEAVLMTRAEGVLSSRPVFDAAVQVLPGFEPVPSFVF
jgi:protein-L-isoaspartate(D-aspartate) O-methyltransferase